MKDFIETVKAGFQELPEFLSIIIILGMIAFVFGGIGGAINVFLVLFGVWAVVFIGLPLVLLIIEIVFGTINHIFGLEETNKKQAK